LLYEGNKCCAVLRCCTLALLLLSQAKVRASRRQKSGRGANARRGSGKVFSGADVQQGESEVVVSRTLLKAAA
jgi:hypothetical protein